MRWGWGWNGNGDGDVDTGSVSVASDEADSEAEADAEGGGSRAYKDCMMGFTSLALLVFGFSCTIRFDNRINNSCTAVTIEVLTRVDCSNSSTVWYSDGFCTISHSPSCNASVCICFRVNTHMSSLALLLSLCLLLNACM